MTPTGPEPGDAAAGPTSRAAAVFTVPPGVDLLDSLARAILAGDLPRAGGQPPDFAHLADITIMLPTRRAARALREAFLAASGASALVLPTIRPIAEADEDLMLLANLSLAGGLGGAEALSIPPVVLPLERLLVLVRMVQAWSAAMRQDDPGDGSGDDDALLAAAERATQQAAAGAGTPAQAARLAAELARLMDLVETENVSLAGIAELAPAEHSEHWQKTLEFLQIVVSAWPAHLAEIGKLSPADRRNRLILAEAQRLATTPPKGPLIIAGVTGSIPATAELMRTVAGLPQGAIVLPGLDTHLDAESFEAAGLAHPEHPQHGLARLLGRLGLTRDDVATLPGADPSSRQATRARLVSEALRPASTSQRWQDYMASADTDEVRAALGDVALIEAPTAQDEAEVVALIMRQTLETPGRTAALVSPDRLLARRVGVRLRSWGIDVDDSAGRPFAKTPPGAFLDLVIDCFAKAFAPVALLALLKHPLLRLGQPARDVRRAARFLEIAVFRQPYTGHGLEGVRRALERADAVRTADGRQHPAARRLWDADWDAAHTLVAQLEQAFAPLSALAQTASRPDSTIPLHVLAEAHVDTAERLAELPADASGQRGLWAEEAGEVGAGLMRGLSDPSLPAPAIAMREYPEFYRALIAGESVRARIPMHPRLSIWGPFEARLQRPDVVILGGLNDGVWPDVPDPGPWLNRPMRAALGLPQPEEKIGFAAHDLSQLVGADHVYLTRSEKVDGNPAVASRWLLRLRAVLSGLGLDDALTPSEPWLAWARARDPVAPPTPIGQPQPRPALRLRPRRLSVSDVEAWIANPYAIFAARILKLAPLPIPGTEPDAAMRGSIIHGALGAFTARHPTALPDDIAGELIALAKNLIADYDSDPRVAAFWRERFDRFAVWFAETEAARREHVIRAVPEVSGRMVLGSEDGLAAPFTLVARADRIDVVPGGLVITDYKTARNLAPLAGRALKLDAPQLPLEAAMAIAGSFAEIPANAVAGLRYISASGGEPAGSSHDLKADDIAALAATARTALARLIRQFDDEATPYRALRRARFSYDYDDYAHLARVGEWGSGDSGEGEGSDETGAGT